MNDDEGPTLEQLAMMFPKLPFEQIRDLYKTKKNSGDLVDTLLTLHHIQESEAAKKEEPNNSSNAQKPKQRRKSSPRLNPQPLENPQPIEKPSKSSEKPNTSSEKPNTSSEKPVKNVEHDSPVEEETEQVSWRQYLLESKGVNDIVISMSRDMLSLNFDFEEVEESEESSVLQAALDESSKTIIMKFPTDKAWERKDWISFASCDQSMKDYLTWYRLNQFPEGIIKVDAPREPRDYEFRLFQNGESQPVAQSNTITIIKRDKIRYKLLNEKVARVLWRIYVVDEHKKDFIELCNEHGRRVTWQYVEMDKGYLDFEIPKEKGSYVFRYMASKYANNPVDTSKALVVQ